MTFTITLQGLDPGLILIQKHFVIIWRLKTLRTGNNVIIIAICFQLQSFMEQTSNTVKISFDKSIHKIPFLLPCKIVNCQMPKFKMFNRPKPKQWGSDCGRYILNQVSTRKNFIRNPIVEKRTARLLSSGVESGCARILGFSKGAKPEVC